MLRPYLEVSADTLPEAVARCSCELVEGKRVRLPVSVEIVNQVVSVDYT